MRHRRTPSESPYASAIESFSIAAKRRDAAEFPPPTAAQLFGMLADVPVAEAVPLQPTTPQCDDDAR